MKFSGLDKTWKNFSQGIIDAVLLCLPVCTRPKTLLLVRLDAIGDYVLFRNFIEVVAKSEKYKDYKIDLCGNKDWRELTETLDSQYLRKCIWIDRRNFKKNTLYKLWKMAAIRLAGYETVIESRYSREYVYGEQVVKAAKAPVSIGSVGDLGNITAEQKKITDQYYTQLIPATEKIIFEFDRNIEFFEYVLGEQVNISKPVIDVKDMELPYYIEPPYVVLFPGGSGSQKRWGHQHFAKLADLIKCGYGIHVVIITSPKEKNIGQLMKMYAYWRNDFIDLSGKTSLCDLVKILNNALLLIANETCAVHFAASVGTPSVCVANGNNIFRFTEYPDNIFNQIEYIYPSVIQKRIDDRDNLAEEYKHNTHGNIHEIAYEEVKKVVVQKLNNFGFSQKFPLDRCYEDSH